VVGVVVEVEVVVGVVVEVVVVLNIINQRRIK